VAADSAAAGAEAEEEVEAADEHIPCNPTIFSIEYAHPINLFIQAGFQRELAFLPPGDPRISPGTWFAWRDERGCHRKELLESRRSH
jgi:hypothetical protein